MAGPICAADHPQQNRMATCNKEAGDQHGEARRAFMSSCLADKKLAQQAKMKDCNARAVEKKGDERKVFMRDCLNREPG